MVAKSYKNLESVITIQLVRILRVPLNRSLHLRSKNAFTHFTPQHKELRTRIGHQILRLQHLLPPSRGVRQLIALHISIYEKLWELDGMVTDMNSREPKPILMESFANLMSEIEGRMSTVVVRASVYCLIDAGRSKGRRLPVQSDRLALLTPLVHTHLCVRTHRRR